MPSQNTTILFVDDDDANRRFLGWIFRNEGFEILEAASGMEALRMAAARPDLVVLDVSLPDIDGFEVCRRIKAEPITASTPVLHVSSVFVNSGDRSQGLESGADAYLVKPVEPRELLATVRALLRIHAAEEAARAASHQWRVTFDAISDPVCLVNAAGVVLRCNQAVCDLLGRP
ncbi:MAG TPA: response regulator, partial [Gemmataceae bacterium]|nr:response regulator [Gemmataceae bacterium]